MGALFGKGSLIDPLGITTSKVGDPLGINRKMNDAVDKVSDPLKLRKKHASILDPLNVTTFGSEDKPKSSTVLG